MKQVRIAVSYGDGVGREIISAAVDLLRAAAKKYKKNGRFLPFDTGHEGYINEGDSVSDKAVALAMGCDAVLVGPQSSHEDELRFAAALGAKFCVMPVTPATFFGAVAVPKGEKLRPSVRLSFIAMQSFYGHYSKESSDGSTLFETEAVNKENYCAAIKYAANIAKKEHLQLVPLPIGDNDFYFETVEKEAAGTEIKKISAEKFAEKLFDNTFGAAVVARDETCAVLHSQAMALLSHRSLCYKKYIGEKIIYMPAMASDNHLAGLGRVSPVGAMVAAADMLDDIGDTTSAAKMRQSIFSVLGHGFKTADIASSGGVSVSTSDFAELVVQEFMK